VTNDRTDYTTSVQRMYQRNSIVSSLKPMMLFVQFKLDDLLSSSGDPKSVEEKLNKFLATLVSKCQAYNLDGLIVQDSDPTRQNRILQALRKLDK
jgi:hypothetical protein